MPIIRTDKPLRSRAEHDFYPTPAELIRAAYEEIEYVLYSNFINYPDYPFEPIVIDLGAGEGEWGNEFKKLCHDSEVTGVDIRELEKPECYDHWIQADVLTMPVEKKYDIVIGNPPYKFAEGFIRKGLELLQRGGLMVFLLPLQFLASQRRGKGLWKESNLDHVMVCSRRPSFTRNGKTDNTDYGIYVWENVRREAPYPQLSWLDWDYDE